MAGAEDIDRERGEPPSPRGPERAGARRPSARSAWRRAAIALIAIVVLGLAVLFGGAAWILYTSAGLQWLASRSVASLAGTLEIDGVEGTLARGARAAAVRFTTDDLSVVVRSAGFVLSPSSLLTLSPRVSDLVAARIDIKTKPSDDPRTPLPDSLALPIELSISNARIGELAFDNGQRVFDLSNVHLEYSGGRRTHRVHELDLSAFGHAIALRGHIDAAKPFALRADIAAVGRIRPFVHVAGTATGTLAEIDIRAHARSDDARATASARVRPYDLQFLTALAIDAEGLDPRVFDAALPQARLSVSADLRAEDGRLRGPVVVRNAMPGPIDKERVPLASLRAEVLTNFAAAGFSELAADLGAAGSISGSGRIEADQASLSLSTQRLDLSALHTRIRPTALKGRAELTLRPERQHVVADLAQDDLRLQLTAHRAGDAIDIPEFRATARGGIAAGAAKLDLGGQRPFSLHARLERFDPSAWGRFPRGAINATLDAKGNMQGPAAEVRFTVRDSTLLAQAFHGNGMVDLTPERLRRANVELALGASRLTAQGALGSAGDTLTVRFDVSRLDLADPRLTGAVRGSALLSGALRSPRIALDASASKLAHRAYGSVQSAAVRARLSPDLRAPMEVHATLTGIATPQVQLRSATVNLEGTRAAHQASVQASGADIDLQLRARGSLSAQNVWSGTLAELRNRGNLPVELLRPVNLRLGPRVVHVEPFELEAVGGRLQVSALDYTPERLHTAGKFAALPVARLVALAAKQAPVRGSLRLSGQWDLTSAPQLRGNLRIARESGDLLIGAERPIDLELRALALNATLAPARIDFNANAELALASASASGTLGAVPGGGILPYSAASPLEFTAAIDVLRLAPFAAFIETAMLLQGEAHARLKGTGTLGKPQIVGRVSASNLGVALPAEGVSLTDGSLSAELAPQEIRVEAFSIRGGEGYFRASGTLARDGFDRASLDWRADRFRALARPDRRLVVSGQGNGSLAEGKVSLTGRLRADEGEFEVGAAASMPTLSSDVVIVGRDVRKPEPAARRFERIALDLRLDLGNRVHITGQGLSVWLSGDLRVTTNARGELRANGTVQARNGTFVAYGQRLVIEQGNLYFNGPITDPGLDIVAMRRRQAVEAGVALSGTLRNPLVRIVSDPPLPQGEALSWLILGRAPNEAGTGELSALPLAGSLLLGKATSPVKDALRLDELQVRGAAGEQFLTVGKRITDRLYLVFEQGLGAAETILRLEFTVTRRVVLRLQAGEPTSAGVFYRRRWD